ncbi:hypothetical protein JTB14_018213 [Gonioctena quinquepunctata]|nr:hypothetical protein JTB14_018213 [Gonioctena quinquepunctata]
MTNKSDPGNTQHTMQDETVELEEDGHSIDCQVEETSTQELQEEEVESQDAQQQEVKQRKAHMQVKKETCCFYYR